MFFIVRDFKGKYNEYPVKGRRLLPNFPFPGIIEEKFPSVKVYFIEEESGCGVFSTNDTSGLFFPEKYWVETDCESNYFETMEEVANCISEIVNREISPTMKDLEEAVSQYMDDNEDCYIAIHEISFV